MTTNKGPDLTRRQAMLAITGVTALMHGRMDSQRRLILPLDGLEGIVVQYQGRSVLLPAAAIMAALSGKGDA